MGFAKILQQDGGFMLISLDLCPPLPLGVVAQRRRRIQPRVKMASN